MAEVVSFIQQSFARDPGQGICKAVAKVQCSPMPAFTELAPCLSGDSGLLSSHRSSFYSGSFEEGIEFVASLNASTTFHHDSRLQQVCRRNLAIH